MKSVTAYPFALNANQTLSLPIEGDYFRIQSATGALDVTVDGSGTLQDLLTGQGLKNTPFKRLTLKDKSGAANAGVILVASEEFIDNRTYGVNDLSAGTLATIRQPLASTGNYRSSTNMQVNTPELVFSAASNLNGAIILTAQMLTITGGAAPYCSMLAKASAPTSAIDGEVLLSTGQDTFNGRSYSDLQSAQYLAPGLGLYFITSIAETLAMRACRFRLL